MDDYGQNIWDTTDENCPLYFDEHEMINLRYSQYFYIASFMLATIRTLELCTASKHLGPKVYFGNLFYSSTHPQFNTSVPHKRATPFQPPKSLIPTPQTPQFNTENPAVPHRKPLGSTPKTPRFNPETPQFNTKNPSNPPPPSVPHQNPLISTSKTLSSTHSSVPHKKPSVQHRKPKIFGMGAEEVWSLCGTDVWNWGVLIKNLYYNYSTCIKISNGMW